MAKNQIEPDQRDVLAFALMSLSILQDVSRPVGFDESPDNYRDTWQNLLPGKRREWREQADSVIGELDKFGLRVKPFNSATLGAKYQWLTTVPPRFAYTEDELENAEAIDPSDPDKATELPENSPAPTSEGSD